ncbi:MAG: cysteine desulfurase, partial [Bacteroidetes bacterium]|nr:cysteine desulfurase [Bacteroidota bacterium]
LITGLEHHSNIVPWQLACERTGATLDVVPVLDSGELDMQEYARLLDRQPALVAAVHTSNSLGTINDIKTMSAMAHEAGSLLLVDAAQAMAHGPVDVQDLGCDFLCLSAHKMFGPTGVGVLYGRRAILESLPPWRGGGDMIDDVSFDGTTFAELPARLEAGTPNIAGVIGFGATIDFLEDVDWSQIEKHETHLLGDATRGLLHIGGISIVGPDDVKAPVISFNIDGVHPYDTGTILDQLGVAVRTGHHCTMPLMKRFGLPGTVRASFALYNNDEDVAQFVSGVEKAKKMLL